MKIYTAFLIVLVIFKNSYSSPEDETNNKKIKLFKEKQIQFKTDLNEIMAAKKNQWVAYCNYQTTSDRKRERMQKSIFYGLAAPTIAYIPAIAIEDEMRKLYIRKNIELLGFNAFFIKAKPNFWFRFLEAFVEEAPLTWMLIGIFTGAAFSTLKTLNYQLWEEPKKEFSNSFDEEVHYKEILAKTNYELDTAKSTLKRHLKESL